MPFFTCSCFHNVSDHEKVHLGVWVQDQSGIVTCSQTLYSCKSLASYTQVKKLIQAFDAYSTIWVDWLIGLQFDVSRTIAWLYVTLYKRKLLLNDVSLILGLHNQLPGKVLVFSAGETSFPARGQLVLALHVWPGGTRGPPTRIH